MYPHVNIILAADTQLELLKTYGHTLFIDGTFSVSELDLTLITLMVKVNEIGIPACWILTNSQTERNYENLLQYVVQETEGRLQPQFIIGDFEEAFHHATSKVWPHGIILMHSIGFSAMFDGCREMKERSSSMN
jgi:hypothetical protein